MKRTHLAARLAALLAIGLASPVAAQKSDRVVTVSMRVQRPVRTVYREAIRAGMRDGYTFRILLLDSALYTLPAKVGDGKTNAWIHYGFETKGDSTTMIVSAVALDADGEHHCTTCEVAELTAALQTVHAVTKRLDSVAVAVRTPADSLAQAGAFGYSTRNPIHVGGGDENGERNQFAWLDALRGPGGERVSYIRIGSCCRFSTPNGRRGLFGFLDAYEVTYPGLAQPVTLYLDLYDPPRGDQLPPGFTRAASTP